MYRLFLGSISALSQTALPPALAAQAPAGPRRSAWIAGRALLSRAVSPLPPVHYGEQGKPEKKRAARGLTSATAATRSFYCSAMKGR